MLLLKYFFDKVLSLILLAISFPVIIVLLVILWRILKDNPLFFQLRVGKGRKLFRVIKLRTENHNLSGWRVGLLNFLRKTHIDEIPQLINVLVGDMSIVGPRPHVPEHVAMYELWQAERLTVKPGITGLRQLKRPSIKMQFNAFIEEDIKYIRSWNFWLDLKIIFKTFNSFVNLLFY